MRFGKIYNFEDEGLKLSKCFYFTGIYYALWRVGSMLRMSLSFYLLNVHLSDKGLETWRAWIMLRKLKWVTSAFINNSTYFLSRCMNQSLSNLMPRVFNIPKVEHDQPCSTLVVVFFQISLFIYFNLGHGPIRAKNNVNKQTNLKNNNNQSWAWLIMLNFGNVKNLGHLPLIQRVF